MATAPWLSGAAGAPPSFVLQDAHRADAATRETVAASNVRRAGEGPRPPARSASWLERVLPIRGYGTPMPAGAEEEFQICYLPQAGTGKSGTQD